MSGLSTTQHPSERVGEIHNFLRARAYEGTQDEPDSLGIWNITGERLNFGLGLIPPLPVPPGLKNGDRVPPLPENVDALAAANRTTGYRRVWSAIDCVEQVSYRPLRIGFEVTPAWLADAGQPLTFDPSATVIGSHCVIVLGADQTTRTLRFDIGSWGEGWGNRGLGRMSFDYFDRHLVEGFASTGYGQRLIPVDDHIYDSGLSTPAVPHFLVVIKRSGTSERLAWAMLSGTQDAIEVDDFFVRLEYRRRGLGRELWKRVLDLSYLRQLPLRLWVPFADCEPTHLELLRQFFGKRGYALLPSSRRSAGCEVRPGPMPDRVPAVVIPDRPALDRTSAVEASIKLGLAVGPDGPPGWRELNKERAALIRKRRQVELDPAEQARFDRLQALAHQIVDANLPPPLSDADRAHLLARVAQK